MLETIKEIMLNIQIILAMFLVIILIGYCIMEMLNRVFRITKHLIAFMHYKKNEEIYNLRGKIVVSSDGEIIYSDQKTIEDDIRILEKAKKTEQSIIELREKYAMRRE